MQHRVLFVWRHNNDFDSTLPIVHAAASDPRVESVFVYVSSEELLWRRDFRLETLREFDNVEICDIWSLVGGRVGSICRWICEYTRMSRGALRKIVPLIAAKIISRAGWREKLAVLVEKMNPTIVAVDWVDVERDAIDRGPWGISQIARWAKASGRPVVGLLHGLSLARFPNASSNASWSASIHRLYIESEGRRAEAIESGIPTDKLVVAGAPRFDPLWVSKIGGLITSSYARRIASANGEARVVFFATKLVYDFDFERVIDWLQHVASMDGIRVTVQPHPRGQGRRQFRRLEKLNNCVIDMHTPASVLIRESDIVSTLVSSVICEAFVLGVPVLYPRFLNTIETRFDEEGACVAIDSLDQTKQAIEICVRQGAPMTKYADFLKDHVWGGRSSPIDFTLNDMLALADESSGVRVCKPA